MNFRYMRLMIFFDLPVLTSKEQRAYRQFRKFLTQNGFIMMQESVYTKLVANNVTSIAEKEKVRKNLPPAGLVEMLEITENQFAKIEYLVGKQQSVVVDSCDRIVEI